MMRQLKLPHPKGFKPAGRVSAAIVTPQPKRYSKVDLNKMNRNQKAGLRFEHEAHEHLAYLYKDTYTPGPWIKFWSGSTKERARLCQPDGLLIDVMKGTIIIIEYKLRHSKFAYHQLRFLYEPVLKVLFPNGWSFFIVEIVKHLEPPAREGNITLPETVNLLSSLENVIDGYNLLQYKKLMD